MDKRGWLVNDTLTCIPGVTTLWHELLSWFPKLEDKTNGYTDYSVLADRIESLPSKPDYIIRNASYFRKMNIDVPTISLVQDIQNNQMQTDVLNSSNIVVFSSNHLYKEYKDRINTKNVRVIKWASDFNHFKPIPERHPNVLPNSIIFVGDSSYEKKGFHRVLDIIDKMPDFNFCLIMKDNTTLSIIPEKNRHRVRIFNKVERKDMPLFMNSCICGICTSGYEEGHWAGVEMGACDIPMVTRPIGCYLDRIDDMSWGEFANDDEFPDKIRYVVSNRKLYSPRKYYSKEYTLERFRENWIKVVEELHKKSIYNCYGDEVFRIFTDFFLSDKPVWIARYGGSDTDTYETIKSTNDISKDRIDSIRKYNGFFCKDGNTLWNVVKKSIDDYDASVQNSDFITIGNISYLERIIEHNNNPFVDKPISSYSFIEAFDPFFKSFKIWGENKKILIISPFSKTIKYQTSADRINKILTNRTFPNCSFITYQTPITYNTDDFTSNYFNTETAGCNSWLELSNKMCNEIKDLDFDIAFISAGIYTMNIGNFIKKNGKKAIYIGGMMNVLFNIYGSRYDTPFFNSFMNKEYQVDVMDIFDDLTNNKSLYVQNDVLGAYMRNKI